MTPIIRAGDTEILWSVVIRPFHNNKEGYQTYDLDFHTRPAGEINWSIQDCKLKGVTIGEIARFAYHIQSPIYNELFTIQPSGALCWHIGKPAQETTNDE